MQHDTHKAPKPRLCACAATAVFPAVVAWHISVPLLPRPPSCVRTVAFVAPVFVGYHDDVAMLPVFLSQDFFFAGNDCTFPGHVSQEDGTAVVLVFDHHGDIDSYVSECGYHSGDSEALFNECVWVRTLILLLLGRHRSVQPRVS